MRRFLGIASGLVTQALFVATLPPVYWFLRNDFAAAAEGPLWIDAAAALQFAIPHSILLHPATRKWVTRRLNTQFYGLLFCAATCMSLWIIFVTWRGSRSVVWAWPESCRPAVTVAFLAAWLALFYSLSLSGLGYQTGLAPWWHWVRRTPTPRREFRPVGAYRYFRHPVYLSFLGLVWLTPVITLDRALLIAMWTPYVFIGSVLKDRRMAGLVGEPYRRYQAEVPAFPFLIPYTLLRRRLAANRLAVAQPNSANTAV